MGYKSSFMDNEVYTAQDVNERFSKLFSGGVSLIESGNILADLNALTSDITGYGVLYDACRVVGTDSAYKISAGTAIMHDGSAITFDSEGYSFTAEAGKYQYVYLKRNEPENRIDILVSETEPEGEYVMLAHINEDGEVLDRRQYARLKVNTNQASTLRRFDCKYTKGDSYNGLPFDAGDGNFSYLIIWGGIYDDGFNPQELHSVEKNVFSIVDGEELQVSMRGPNNGQLGFCYIRKNGQIIESSMKNTVGTGAEYTINYGII